MKLYLIRHGDALPHETDAQRALSSKGQIQVRQLAEKLVEQGAKPAYIYHSGILRAQQTAQMLAEHLQAISPVKIPDLLPDDPIEPILQTIETWTQDTFLVGHLPYMAYLLGALSEEGYAIRFGTATAVCLLRTNERWLVQTVIHF